MESFLEDTPLYQKVLIVPEGKWYYRQFSKLPAITTRCLGCGGDYTFNANTVDGESPSTYFHSAGSIGKEGIFRIVYQCKKCNSFTKEFLIRFITEHYDETDDDDEYDSVFVQKIGQFPAYIIEPEPTLKSYLDEKNLSLYERGIICESQSYGIGAFAYYRQIVENKIDDLLDEVEKFVEVTDDAKKAFSDAKISQDTAKKIKLVSDYLPSILKPDGKNVLRMIYTALSDGLHNKSDEECLEVAQSLRACLVFLIKKVEEQKADVDKFKSSVKALQTKVQSSKTAKK